jgi:hypothetical protein
MHYITDAVVILDYEVASKTLFAEVLWLDKYASPTIEIPDAGRFKIPVLAVGQKQSQVLLGVVLQPDPIL